MSKLVAYFSASGTTRAKAELLAQTTGADIYEIKPAQEYTPADIKWTNPLARCNKEWLKKSRPALADTDADIAAYDTVYLAFPIWYFTAPLIIRTFLESYDFAGKKIVLFATSGGSDLSKAAAQLESSAPGAEITNGIMLNGEITADDLKNY